MIRRLSGLMAGVGNCRKTTLGRLGIALLAITTLPHAATRQTVRQPCCFFSIGGGEKVLRDFKVNIPAGVPPFFPDKIFFIFSPL